MSPDQAATLPGVTEDQVLIRQGRSELPARLTEHALAADLPAPSDPDPTLRPTDDPTAGSATGGTQRG